MAAGTKTRVVAVVVTSAEIVKTLESTTDATAIPSPAAIRSRVRVLFADQLLKWRFISGAPFFLLVFLTSPGQFAVGPNDIFVGRATSLVLSVKDFSELFQIRFRRFIMVGPAFFVCAFGLEPP